MGSIAFHTLTVEVKVSFRQDETKTSEQHKQKQIRRKRDSERKEKFKTFCRVCSNDFSSATGGPQPYIFPSSIQFSLVPGKGPCRKLFVFPSVFLLLLTMLLVLIYSDARPWTVAQIIRKHWNRNWRVPSRKAKGFTVVSDGRLFFFFHYNIYDP